MQEEELKEILVTAQYKYPGRTWEQLSREEQDAVFEDYEGQRALAGSLVDAGRDMMRGAGKNVGPYDLYINNPYESLAGGLMSGAGYGLAASSSRDSRLGREATADMITNRDARDRQYENSRSAEEERRRQQWLSKILGR